MWGIISRTALFVSADPSEAFGGGDYAPGGRTVENQTYHKERFKLKKRLVSVVCISLILVFNSVPAFAAGAFSDVPASNVFCEGITYCAERGVINGYEDGTFRPANTVTRMNFIVMLSRAFYPDDVAKYTTDSNLKYGRFTPNWVALNYNNILDNTSFDSFDDYQNSAAINSDISRYDMAMLMTNIMSQKGFTASADQKNAIIANIADYNSIPSQYKDAVLNVYALGIIGGYPNGNFMGSATMNRGQAAIVIHRMAQKSGIEIKKPVDTGTETPAPQPAPDPGNTETPVPSTPTGTTTGTTLVDGSEITEENVMRLMEARIAEWGNKKWGESQGGPRPYPLGDTGDVRDVVWQYAADGTVATRVTCAAGCGGWATYLSDAAFGTKGFPLRKTTFENMRAGDIVINMIDGKITHITVASGRTLTADVGYMITYKGVYTTNAGTIPGKHDRYLHANSPRILNYDSTTGDSVIIYTRYPD